MLSFIPKSICSLWRNSTKKNIFEWNSEIPKIKKKTLLAGLEFQNFEIQVNHFKLIGSKDFLVRMMLNGEQ